MQVVHAFDYRLNEYLEYSVRGLVTLEAACAAMHEPPKPSSRHHLEDLLRDPRVFQIYASYDSQYAYARLIHEVAVVHFPEDQQIASESALVVLRTAVEVLVNRHDGRIYRDALQVGESCLNRITAEVNSPLFAELNFRLGRLHLEPVALDPAYGPPPDGLDLCMAARHNRQLWVFEETPASQVELVPDRITLLGLAVDRFSEAVRLGSAEQRTVSNGYLTLAKLELTLCTDDTAPDRLIDEAATLASQIPPTEDPIIGLRLRYRAASLGAATGTLLDNVRIAINGDFTELVKRYGISQIAAAWVMVSADHLPRQIRPGAYFNYQNLAALSEVDEYSRIFFRLRSGHCHPDDPTECATFEDSSVSDIRSVLTRIQREHPNISAPAFARATLHWFVHQKIYDFESTKLVRELLELYGGVEESEIFLTSRAMQQVNFSYHESTHWMSAISLLCGAIDLMHSGLQVWAQHCLYLAQTNLDLVLEAGEASRLPPVVGLIEQLIEVGWPTGIRHKIAKIISSVTSLATAEASRQWNRLGGIEYNLINVLFELNQLSKSRALTARILNDAPVGVSGQEWFHRIYAQLGVDSTDSNYDGIDDALEEAGIRSAFYLTRSEAKSGNTHGEIVQNLRMMYGISIAAASANGASPALRRSAVQAVLDPQSLGISLQYCSIPGEGEMSGFAVLSAAVGSATFTVNVSPQGEDFTIDNLMGMTLAPPGLGFYEISPFGAMISHLLRCIKTDPLVRNVSAEATRELAAAAARLPGFQDIVTSAYEDENVRHLIIWPSKDLYLLPYWLLPFRDGIVADYLLVTLTPTFQCLTRDQCTTTRRGVLSVGSSSGGTSYGLPKVPSLTTTALRIARSFGSDALVGRRASPASVLRQLGSYEFVHISAHGSQDRGAPIFHCVYLESVDGAEGRLFAHQILDLDLSGVRLVTLNACEGVLLRFDQLDEIVGLSSAFLLAGAHAVIGALWKIRPEVGEIFYATIYAYLARNAGTLTAFRAAQIETRRSFPEYRDWGAFCFIGAGTFGDPESPD